MSDHKKHPLVDNKLRAEGEPFDKVFGEINAKHGVAVWLTNPDELGRIRVVTNYYNCDYLQGRALLDKAQEDKFIQDLTYSVIHALGEGERLYADAKKRDGAH